MVGLGLSGREPKLEFGLKMWNFSAAGVHQDNCVHCTECSENVKCYIILIWFKYLEYIW